jgi:hypothetical protein
MGIRRISGLFIVAGLLSFGAVLRVERAQSVIAFQANAG